MEIYVEFSIKNKNRKCNNKNQQKLNIWMPTTNRCSIMDLKKIHADFQKSHLL
jgi:hypothetical protein